MGRILVFVVAYQAEDFISEVLERIRKQLRPEHEYETLVIDDSSKDNTFEKTREYAQNHPEMKITNLYNPINQGYGGNQQIGYQYAIEHNFDVVILLHGDGQYPPEQLNEMADPILCDQYDVMLGSRMVNKKDALAGGMPFYKWVGNQILTWTENRLLGQNLSEYHTGFRAYRVSALKHIPFRFASKDFDFDTDILIQVTDSGFRIGEIPIPTRYGDEICRVNGTKYAVQILKSCIQSRIMRLGLFYNPKFDYLSEMGVVEADPGKFGTRSTHQMALESLQPGNAILDLGAGNGFMEKALKEKGIHSTAIDSDVSPELEKFADKAIQADLNDYKLTDALGSFDVVLMLDILEQVDSAENLLLQVREAFAPQMPRVLISVGNVAFFITRFSLFFGKFNYGRLGILDMNKKRLFTQKSIRRVLKDNGYKVKSVKGVPAPYQKAIGDTALAKGLRGINSGLLHISKGLFAYQLFIEAVPSMTVAQLLDAAQKRK